MPSLTPDQKREITTRLGYTLTPDADGERHDLTGPDGRHRGLFRRSRATDLWVWNDAVFAFELYQDREGAVHVGGPAAPGRHRLQRIWPEGGDAADLPSEVVDEHYERLSGSPTI